MISLAIDKADAVIQDEKLKDLHDNLLHVQYYHENYVSTHDFHDRKIRSIPTIALKIVGS